MNRRPHHNTLRAKAGLSISPLNFGVSEETPQVDPTCAPENQKLPEGCIGENFVIIPTFEESSLMPIEQGPFKRATEEERFKGMPHPGITTGVLSDTVGVIAGTVGAPEFGALDRQGLGGSDGVVGGIAAGKYFDMGTAIRLLKSGGRAARTGWNGKGMWIELQVPDEHSKMRLPYIYMSTADKKLVPWLASQTDILAEDWEIV